MYDFVNGENIDFKAGTKYICQMISGLSTDFRIQSPVGTANFFNMNVGANGATTMLTLDADGTVGHLTIAPNGILKVEADDGGISIKEIADAGTNTAGYGQLWVHDTTPNDLCFTNDVGSDIVGIGRYHYETKFIAYVATATGIYFPMNGYIIEGTATAGRNEYQGFIAPFDGVIQKVGFRSEIAQAGDFSFRVLESADGTEIPGTTIFRHETGVDIADDTYQEIDLTDPGTGTSYSPLTKGRIYMIYLSTPSATYDTNIVMVFKWDILS